MIGSCPRRPLGCLPICAVLSGLSEPTRKPAGSPQYLLARSPGPYIFRRPYGCVFRRRSLKQPNFLKAAVRRKFAPLTCLPQTPEVGSDRERKKPCEKIDDKLKQNFGGACQTVLSAILKTPQDKDMFISGSLEAGLFTQTQVKSKGNNRRVRKQVKTKSKVEILV